MQRHVIELKIVGEEKDAEDNVPCVLRILPELDQALVCVVWVDEREDVGLGCQLVVMKVDLHPDGWQFLWVAILYRKYIILILALEAIQIRAYRFYQISVVNRV